MPIFKRTRKAEEDLVDIWVYIAQDNPAAADRLLDEIDGKRSLDGAKRNPGYGLLLYFSTASNEP